jgi:hypothetical protein
LDAAVSCRKALRCIRQRNGASAPIGKHEVADGDKVGTRGWQRLDLFE